MSEYNIQLVSLVNGQLIVCDLVDEPDANNVILKNPLTFAHTEQGVQPVPLNPFVQENDLELVVNRSHVLYITEPRKEVSDVWSKNFGSGLVEVHQNMDSIIKIG